MRTINIKGKEYVPVVERVKEFHKLYPEGSITTQVTSLDEKRVIVKATVKMPADRINIPSRFPERTFTGYSQAEWGKGMMGGVALEVAETSSVGRALGFAGIGLIDGIASADEIKKVSKNDGTGENYVDDGSAPF